MRDGASLTGESISIFLQSWIASAAATLCLQRSLPPSRSPPTLKREAATQEEAAVSAERTDQEDALCVVCMDLPNTHAFVPCGHRCVCAECSQPILQSSARCPVCRAHVTQAIKIF